MDLKRMIEAAKEFADLYEDEGFCGFHTDIDGSPEIQLTEAAFIECFGKRPAMDRYGRRAYALKKDGVTIFALVEKEEEDA